MLVTRTVRGLVRLVRRSGGQEARLVTRSLWTGRESLETDDPEMWSLVQEEKRRQVRLRAREIVLL